MIIALDVDDVCLDLIHPWLKRYNYDYDDNLKKEQITDWSVHNFVKPECGQNIYNYIEDKSLYDDAKAIPFAFKATNILRRMGRVIFVTSSTSGASGRKYLWLKEHGFIHSIEDYVEARDKQLIKFDILIDDNYHNIKHSDKNFLFSQPWNLKYSYPNRLNGWRNFVATGKLI